MSASAEPSRSYGSGMTTSGASVSTAPSAAEPARRDPALTPAVLAAVLVTVFAWASAFLAIRGVRVAFDPGALALGRLAVGTVALGAAVLARRTWVPPTRREWALLAACGVLWFGIYNVALNAAEQHVDAGTAACSSTSARSSSPCSVGPSSARASRAGSSSARASRSAARS